jgi:hypothetical protein
MPTSRYQSDGMRIWPDSEHVVHVTRGFLGLLILPHEFLDDVYMPMHTLELA